MKPKWMTPSRSRSSASTGARVSASKFSPTSPKGGFGTNVYEGVRYLDENYGYRTESYYKQRLLGQTPSDYKWRYDLNKHLIGRDYHRNGNVSFPWLPRFPKKKYRSPTTSRDFQEGPKLSRGQSARWLYQRATSGRSGRNLSKANQQYRQSGTFWFSGKVHRGTILYIKLSKYPLLHKLQSPVYSNRSRYSRPSSRWR